MAETLDLLLCILPFEKTLFSHTSLRTVYVGHPLIERLKTYDYKFFSTEKKLIALFPGSRKKEIERNLPLMLEASVGYPDFQIALSISEENLRPQILTILKEKGWDLNNILLVPANLSYELMKQAHFAIAKSGTVTLELALHRTPTIVVYRVSFIDQIIAYQILRIRLPFYCLVNIIAQKQVFKELIGPNFTIEKMHASIKEILDPAVRFNTQKECNALIELLGDKNTSDDAAIEIFKHIST